MKIYNHLLMTMGAALMLVSCGQQIRPGPFHPALPKKYMSPLGSKMSFMLFYLGDTVVT